MGNNQLTEEMIDRELWYYAKWLGMNENIRNNLKVRFRYDPFNDTNYIKITYKNEFEERPFNNNHLNMSLDGFNDKFLIPIFAPLADRLGYATWD